MSTLTAKAEQMLPLATNTLFCKEEQTAFGTCKDCLREGHKLNPAMYSKHLQGMGSRFHEPMVSFLIESSGSLLDYLDTL
jgi:hypothetical protein